MSLLVIHQVALNMVIQMTCMMGKVTESAVARITTARDGAVTKWRCTVSYTHFVARISNGCRNFCSFMGIGQANALSTNILNYLQCLHHHVKAQ